MSSLGQLNIQLILDSVQVQQVLSKSERQTQKFVKIFVVDKVSNKEAVSVAERSFQCLSANLA